MLKSFVTTDDLKKYYPNLTEQLWKSQPDCAPQIVKAVDTLWNQLRNLGNDPRLVMVPLDLWSPDGSAANSPLVTKTLSTNENTIVYRWHDERRIVVDATSVGLSGAMFKVYGSNVSSKPAVSDSVWTLIDSVEVASTGQKSVVLPVSYRWIYVAVEAVAEIIHTLYAVESVFDELIELGTLMLVFREYPEPYKLAEKEYTTKLTAIRFGFDSDESGAISDDEADLGRAQVRLTR